MVSDEVKPRYYADGAAVVIHLISLIAVMASTPEFAATTPGQILCAMEVVTIVAHVVYVCRYNNENYTEWQVLKWAEYAISATLGIFAVAYVSDADVSFNVIFLLAAAGMAQQSQGYQLEYYMNENPNKFSWSDKNIVISFVVASALQVGEFLVVSRIIDESSNVSGTEWLVYWSYVVGYSLFGVIMAGVIRYEVAAEKAEVVYTIAGIFSKLAILFGDLAAFNGSYVGAACVLAMISVATTLIVAFSFEAVRVLAKSLVRMCTPTYLLL